jgi:Right handed beta helix region
MADPSDSDSPLRPRPHARRGRSLATRLRHPTGEHDRLVFWTVGWVLVIALAAVIGLRGPGWLWAAQAKSGPPAAVNTGTAGPASPPVRVCGNNAILGRGPASPPPGAIRVRAGDDSAVDWTRTGAVYWFAPGTHTLGPGEYSQIIPGRGSTYIGAPGAVIDGMNVNNIAFGGNVPDVTIEYLTIKNFSAPGNQGAVNASVAAGWTVKYDTISNIVPGIAVYAGTDNVIEMNCLTKNGEGAFGTYTVHDTNQLTAGASNVIVDDNEISYNDTCNWEAVPNFPGPKPPSGCAHAGEYSGCGCSAGGKFWQTDGGQFDDNYVHDNYTDGVWWDTNNVGFEIEGNYISGNYGDGLIYEISYNALIKRNTFIRNGIGQGRSLPGFPTSAIYISESGSDAKVPGKYGSAFLITDNTFNDNWGGVVLWENSNRFCNSPANSSTGTCTLVDPAVVTIRSCDPANIATAPYFADCRWKTQNVQVTHNIFSFDPDDLGPACTEPNACGFQGLFSEYGTYPSWSPYKGDTVGRDITFDQNNVFAANSYYGPWNFEAHEQGNIINWQQWQSSPYDQDKGSSLDLSGS